MENNAELPLLTSNDVAKNAHFTADIEDIPPIKGINDFFFQLGNESKKLWYLAGPAIFTTICQYSLGAITQTFAGHVGTLELAAVSIENSVIAGFSLGILVSIYLSSSIKFPLISFFQKKMQRLAHTPNHDST